MYNDNPSSDFDDIDSVNVDIDHNDPKLEILHSLNDTLFLYSRINLFLNNLSSKYTHVQDQNSKFSQYNALTSELLKTNSKRSKPMHSDTNNMFFYKNIMGRRHTHDSMLLKTNADTNINTKGLRKPILSQNELKKLYIHFSDKIDRYNNNRINYDVDDFFEMLSAYIKLEFKKQINDRFSLIKILVYIHNINMNYKSQKNWTIQEDSALLKSIEKYGLGSWKIHSYHVDNKNSSNCVTRYYTRLFQKKTSNWTLQEDIKLDILVKIYGHSNWSYISDFFTDRTDTQIRERYSNSLDPNIRMTKLDERDDIILINTVFNKKMEYKYKHVKHVFPTVTDNYLLRKWRLLSKEIEVSDDKWMFKFSYNNGQGKAYNNVLEHHNNYSDGIVEFDKHITSSDLFFLLDSYNKTYIPKNDPKVNNDTINVKFEDDLKRKRV